MVSRSLNLLLKLFDTVMTISAPETGKRTNIKVLMANISNKNDFKCFRKLAKFIFFIYFGNLNIRRWRRAKTVKVELSNVNITLQISLATEFGNTGRL